MNALLPGAPFLGWLVEALAASTLLMGLALVMAASFQSMALAPPAPRAMLPAKAAAKPYMCFMLNPLEPSVDTGAGD